jgi:hypothetical protein
MGKKGEVQNCTRNGFWWIPSRNWKKGTFWEVAPVAVSVATAPGVCEEGANFALQV